MYLHFLLSGNLYIGIVKNLLSKTFETKEISLPTVVFLKTAFSCENYSMRYLPKFTKITALTKVLMVTFLTILTFTIVFAQLPPSTAADRLNGLKKRKLLEDRSILKDIKFRNIGPSIMSGRVVDMDVNPMNPIEFYLAYA